MKKNRILTCLISLAILFTWQSCKNELVFEVNEKMILNDGWTFHKEGETNWLPATVPGCVHTDLLNNKQIPDPFYRNNEKQLQWIDKKDWVYRCTFKLDSAQLSHNKILLRFLGLDTYASVSLNGEHILDADNMFRTWDADVTHRVIEGENILEIVFRSPVREGLAKLDELGYGLPASNDQSEIGGLGDKKISVFTRKAPYHYGWDWGPRFVTSGVWRPVEMHFLNHAKIEHVYFQQSLVNEMEASIDAILDIYALMAGEYEVAIFQDSEDEAFVSTTLPLEEGLNSVTLPFTVVQPELWWPNGMGDPHLYKLHTRLSLHNVIVDTLSRKLGIRSLELVREPDSTGRSFYFVVNGKPVFAKGANYIPNDNFLNRVTPEKYEEVVRTAAVSNMNMLRVWGGGIYENNILYDLCDKYGILVWQDFMFACSLYPGDNAFLENVRKEAIENVKRLQNHPCIALWCGNNEIDAAWCEGDMDCGWGWKKQFTPDQRKAVWHNYDTLFHKILPEVIELYDPVRPYWPSSPLADWGKTAGYHTTGEGDMHYWGVWHGNEPFSSYFRVIGRFMSEYGFQSMPAMPSIKKFTLPEDWDFESDVLLAHQRSGYGNARIIDYMKELYPVPDKFTDLLYVSQVMQAEAIKSAIGAHRANKPHCMGSLYWQLNDCWPAASWSSMDYYGSWKALQYFARKAYAPLTISFFPDKDTVRVYLNSDLEKSRDVIVQYSICHFNGEILKQESLPSVLDPAKGVPAFVLSVADQQKKNDLASIYLFVEIIEKDATLAADHYFFVAPKDLKLSRPEITSTPGKNRKNLSFELSTDKLAKNLYLWIDSCDARFSDNYFDLLPGEKKVVTLESCEDKPVQPEDVKILTMNEMIQISQK